jgi:hypothetical protein
VWVVAALVAMDGQTPASAAAADSLAAIRDEITKLKTDYEAKIKDLEDRLAKAEAEAAAAKEAAATAQTAAEDAQKTAAASQAAPPPAPEPQRPPASPNAFNPNVSAVLNGFYSAASHDPATVKIPGFALGDEAQGLERGFSLGESEINLNANIDPFLFGWLNLSLPNNNQVSVEEAYLQTTSLGEGLTLKAGEFFSGIAYLNEQHSHNWSFSDASLPYRVFLNGQYGDMGVQARWLAPVNIILEFGAEAFRGDAYPSVHTGDDINESSSWLLGLSYLHANSDRRETGSGDIFSGSDDLAILSLVYKWAPGGNLLLQNLILSSEFFFDREDGSFNGLRLENFDRTGWYLQGMYQFMPRWSFGVRYAQLGTNGVGGALDGSVLDDLGHIPRTESALLELDTSEFGRLRLQYTHDDSDVKPLDQILLQYTIIYGPHPAHRY